MSTAAAAAVDTSKGAGGGQGQETKAATAPATGLLGDAATKAKEAATDPAADPAKDPKAAAPAQQQANGKPARPEHVPEQFWDVEKGEIKHEAWAKSWSDFRAKAKEGRGEVPEKPDAYTLSDIHEKAKTPDDPAYQAIREAAHEAGLTTKQFQKLTDKFLTAVQSQLPKPVSVDEELVRLHPDKSTAQAIVTNVAQKGEHLVKIGVWSETDFVAVCEMGSTAEGVAALNKLFAHYTREGEIPTGTAVDGSLPSKDEWYKAMGEASAAGDQGKLKKLREQGKRIFGEVPVGTSEKGLGVPGGRR